MYCKAEVKGISVYVEMTQREMYDPDALVFSVYTEVHGQLFFFARPVKVSELDFLEDEDQ